MQSGRHARERHAVHDGIGEIQSHLHPNYEVHSVRIRNGNPERVIPVLARWFEQNGRHGMPT